MRKNIILAGITLLLFSCNKEKISKEYFENGCIKSEILLINDVPSGYFKEYFENGKLKTKGNFENGKRQGVFYEYNSDGTMFSIDKYKNGILEGESIGYDSSVKIYIEYINGYPYKQKIIDTLSNFLFGDCNGEYCRYYDDINNKISIIVYNKDTNNIKEIAFDTSGKIYKYTPPLDFLTKGDSSRLNKDYPDWKEQIKTWEGKQK